MEAQESMILRDMPIETRNYIIIDNITGKPIDQSNYTLSIDPEVIGKLNKLKKINEEKVKQAALKEKYGNTNIASTFTPKDNAVFTPVYNDEYIDFHDFNTNKEEEPEIVDIAEPEVIEEQPEEQEIHAEVFKSETLLDRVVARDPSIRLQEQEKAKALAQENEQPKVELDYISNYDPANENQSEENTGTAVDNSLFTPEMASFQQASEQIVKIDTKKLGEDIKATKEREGTERIRLDRMEVISGRKIAWMAYILFFIPLLIRKNNRFVRLHANEGLELNIMEIISGLMVGQYFLLPKLIESLSEKASMVSFIVCMIGVGLLGACALTCVISLIASLFGNQHQTPWLWKRRIIHVPTERTSDR